MSADYYERVHSGFSAARFFGTLFALAFLVALFSGPFTCVNSQKSRPVTQPPRPGLQEITFDQLPLGSYAVATRIDENHFILRGQGETLFIIRRLPSWSIINDSVYKPSQTQEIIDFVRVPYDLYLLVQTPTNNYRVLRSIGIGNYYYVRSVPQYLIRGNTVERKRYQPSSAKPPFHLK